MSEERTIQKVEPLPRPIERRRVTTAVAAPLEVEEVPDLLAYWRIIRKRRWTILTVFVILVAVTLLGTLRQKPIYRARALLEIQKENPEITTVEEMFKIETVTDTYLETQYRILQSDSLARRVIQQLRLDHLPEFNPLMQKKEGAQAQAAPAALDSGEGPPARDRNTDQIVLARFRSNLSVDPVKRSRLVEISFESPDPELAARVVNTLAASFVEQSLEARWEATQKATEWLSQQLVGMKAKLEKSEEQLQKYARENGLLFIESAQGNQQNIVNERLRQLQEELTRAQADRFEKEAQYKLVQAGDFEALPGVVDNRLMQELTVKLAEQRREEAELLATFSAEYPKVKQVRSQIEETEKILERERSRVAKKITNDYLAAVKREDFLKSAFAQQKAQADSIAERSVQYLILKREVETNRQLYEGLLQRMKEAGVSAGMKASNVRIVDPAEAPMRPVKPRLMVNLAFALVLGLALGLGTAFFQEHLDNTLKSPQDVERWLNLPALAFIPSANLLEGRRGAVYGVYGHRRFLGSVRPEKASKLALPKSGFRIDDESFHQSALSEAFRSLRTSVLLSAAEHPPRSLLITSARPGEGKTTVSANLAISLAQLGRRVLLVEADLRRPALHKLFGLESTTGIVTFLTGQSGWRDVVHPSGLGGLDVMFCGPVPPNPAELLASNRMRELLEEATRAYDIVLLDSPPMLNVADGRVLAAMVEAVILIVKGGDTPRDLVQQAHACVAGVGSHVIGVVLNNLDVRSDQGYYYYAYEYYSAEENRKKQTDA